MSRVLKLSVASLCLTLAVGAQPWEKKPWPKWSKKEAERVLERSPWVAKSSVGTAAFFAAIVANLQWRSARPIRQAYAQLARLGNPDITEQELLMQIDQPVFAQYLVVTLEFTVEESTAVPNEAVGRAVYFQNARDYLKQLLDYQSRESLKNDAYLTKKNGDRIPLHGYRAPQGGGRVAILFFPRFYQNGNPTLTLADERVTFTVEMGSFGRVRREFKLEKMTFGGQLEL